MSKKFGVFSRGILNIPFLTALLGAAVVALRVWHRPRVEAIAGWGQRPSTRKSRAYARRYGLPYVALEDGFLRSFGTGDHFPPISIVLDDEGIYYDCTRASALERLLNSKDDVLLLDASVLRSARMQLLHCSLSKYNHAPMLAPGVLRAGEKARVLVIDQTEGDMSVALGGADAQTFRAMLAAAKAEHPDATVYVKTHPEVASGRKGGYLTGVEEDQQTVLLRDAVNPLSLIEHMDHVYVVSSTMGFEALLAGRQVTCFGVPWYAGWGATDDRQAAHPAMARRTRTRSVDE
ncbi:capsular polysaccharide biosynthesis protein, partial [Acidovorax cavernicola]